MRTESPRKITMNTPRPEPIDTEARVAERYVFIVDLADYLKRTPSALHERSRRLGIHPVSIRRAVSGKAAMAVTTDEAKRLMALDVRGAEIVRPEDLAGEKP